MLVATCCSYSGCGTPVAVDASNAGAARAMSAETMKMPEPIIEPINHTEGRAVRHMALRAGDQAPPEVQAVLARIERLNPTLAAYVLVDAEAALAAARESEARWQAGQPLSAIDGVPTSIKDLILTRGWPTLR